jgi:low affinity Fe/Cu permease
MGEPLTKKWTTRIGQAAGHPAAFLIVIVYAVLWLIFSPVTFEWNAIATIAVFAMTLLIQRATRRDTLALHAKLDELLTMPRVPSSHSSTSRNLKRSSAIATRKSARRGLIPPVLPEISASGSGY